MFSNYYRPVQNLTYMLDYWLWNRNAFGYHLSNILFHAASAFLLFLVLKKVLPVLLKQTDSGGTTSQPRENTPVIAALVALVWVVHPIHNAAVAYISGRADSLASLFALSAWLLWNCTDSPATVKKCLPAGVASALLLLLALCSKEIALVWIALFLFYLFVFDYNRSRKARITTCGAIAVTLLTYWILRHLPEKGISSSGMPLLSLDVRVLFALRALGDYACLIFFPAHLQMERAIYNAGAYDGFVSWQNNIRLEYLSTAGLLVLLAALFLCWKKTPGQRVRIFGAVWFMIGFLPVSNLFPLNAQSAEHWIYMPSIGFLIFLAGCYMALPKNSSRWLAAPFCAAVVLLGIRTWVRCGDWISPEIFYTRTIEQGGGTCRIQLNLADLSAQRGDLSGAEKLLRGSVTQYPGELMPRIHLGRILMREGKTEEARAFLSLLGNSGPDRPANEPPKTWKAAQSLAAMKQSEGKLDEALAILNDALTRYGEVWELVALKAQIMIKKEGDKAGLAIMQRFAADHWWHYGAYLVLARLQQRTGDIEAALTSLRHAAKLDIHSIEPYLTMARFQAGAGNVDAALETLRYTAKKDTGASEPLALAAQIEFDRNHLQAALDFQQNAIQRDPGDLNLLSLLSKIYIKMDRKKEAQEVLRKILDSAPE